MFRRTGGLDINTGQLNVQRCNGAEKIHPLMGNLSQFILRLRHSMLRLSQH
jgi:hypothetical protein